MNNYKGFAIVKNDTSLETKEISMYCLLNDVPILRIKDENTLTPKNYIPCGSVEWCLLNLGINITPDYYPKWLKDHLHRKVWRENKWILDKKLFVKPDDRYKRFDGFVTDGTYSKKKKPPLIWSEVVKFENEWRYYIADGIILCGEWYYGDDINTPEAPELNINIPTGYCGALDFGMLNTGKLALVEAQHPFACGWYGKDTKKYIKWLIAGWDYMLEIVETSSPSNSSFR